MLLEISKTPHIQLVREITLCLMKWMRTTKRNTTNANSAAWGSFPGLSNNYTAKCLCILKNLQKIWKVKHRTINKIALLTTARVVASTYWATPHQCYGGTFGLHVIPLKSTALIKDFSTSMFKLFCEWPMG